MIFFRAPKSTGNNGGSLRSKRFRAVSEQRKTEERDSRFWPLLQNNTETLASQASLAELIIICNYQLGNVPR